MMEFLQSLCFLCVSMLILMSSDVVAAQESAPNCYDDLHCAQKLTEALNFVSDGKLIDAISSYKDAYRLSNDPILSFNIGVLHYRIAEKSPSIDEKTMNWIESRWYLDVYTKSKFKDQEHARIALDAINTIDRYIAAAKPAQPSRPKTKSRLWLWLLGSGVVTGIVAIGLGVGLHYYREGQDTASLPIVRLESR